MASTNIEVMSARQTALRGGVAGILVTLGLGAAAVLAAVPAQMAGATTTSVGCDASALTSAVTAAASGDTLSLASGCTYTLTTPSDTANGGTGLPVISKSLAILGNGAMITTAAGSTFRIFDVEGAGNLGVDHLTIDHGAPTSSGGGGIAIGLIGGGALTVTNSTFSNDSTSGNGGGILNQNGTLTVTDSTFSKDSANFGGGGGIMNLSGTLTVTDSTFSNDSANFGGGIDNSFLGAGTITNSTLSDNSAPFQGGGINNFGTLTITNSTVSDNSAAPYGNGDGIANGQPHPPGPPPYGTLTLIATIVSGNGAGGDCALMLGPHFSDGGSNLADDTSCQLSLVSDVIGSPNLGPLQNNGGPTETRALLTGSPAIGHVLTGCPATDQRGLFRPTPCDIGAYDTSGVTVGTQPTITTQPIDQTVNWGDNVTWTVGASGIPTPTLDWQLSVDGGVTWIHLGPLSGTTVTGGLVNDSVNGWQIRATFTNPFGSATTEAATLTLAPPSTTVGLPSNGATVSGGQWLDASASRGVTKVVYELTGGTLNQAVIATATPTIVGWLAGWDTTTVPNATYTLQSVASYPGGVSGTSSPVTITVNNAPPSTVVGLPSNGATVSGGQWLDASASRGVTKVVYELTGGTLNRAVIATATPTIVGWLAGWDTTTVPNGTYTLESDASYAGGVSGTSAPVTIIVNN